VGGAVGGTRAKRRRGSSARPCKPNWPLAPVEWTYSAINSGVFSHSSGKNVVITSGGDTTIQASNVIADKDVSMTAGGNINILAAKNTETNTSQSTSSSTSIGLLPGLSPRQTLFAWRGHS